MTRNLFFAKSQIFEFCLTTLLLLCNSSFDDKKYRPVFSAPTVPILFPDDLEILVKLHGVDWLMRWFRGFFGGFGNFRLESRNSL